jgi:type II secretory pathway pseudopilin PulG
MGRPGGFRLVQFAREGGASGKLKMVLCLGMCGEARAAFFLLPQGSMIDCPILRHSGSRRGERGFTMVELALTFTIIAIMAAMMIPKFSQAMQATRVNRTAAIVAADLEQAFSLAARYRKPMRLSCTCGSATYTVADRTGGTVRLRRQLGDSELGNVTLAFSNTIDIFPSGISTLPDTVTITSGTSTKRIVVSTVGQVRILP